MRGKRGYRLQAVGLRELEPDALAYFAGGYEGQGKASVPLGFVNVNGGGRDEDED